MQRRERMGVRCPDCGTEVSMIFTESSSRGYGSSGPRRTFRNVLCETRGCLDRSFTPEVANLLGLEWNPSS
ncbi:hypothetical protein GCM10009722_33310 [Williamsia deligens]|nr:hypothetical protein [Williamsia deligens]